MWDAGSVKKTIEALWRCKEKMKQGCFEDTEKQNIEMGPLNSKITKI